LSDPAFTAIRRASFHTIADCVQFRLRFRLVHLRLPLSRTSDWPFADESPCRFVAVRHAPRTAEFPIFRCVAQRGSKRILLHIPQNGQKMVAVLCQIKKQE